MKLDLEVIRQVHIYRASLIWGQGLTKMMKILQNKGKNLAALYSCLNSMKEEVKVQSKLVKERDLHRIPKAKKEEGGLTTLSNLGKAQISYLVGKHSMIRCLEVDLTLI